MPFTSYPVALIAVFNFASSTGPSEMITVSPLLWEDVILSTSYISRFIKQATGRKFSEILAELRLEKAKKLLRSSNLKITQIAEQVGYPNLQYFTRVFTGQMNMTPAEYRKITTYF